MATVTDPKTRRMDRIHDEITELEQSVVDDSIAAYSAGQEYYEVDPSKENWQRYQLYRRAWEASVAALLVKRAVLVYLEGGEADDPDPTF